MPVLETMMSHIQTALNFIQVQFSCHVISFHNCYLSRPESLV